MLQEGSDSGIKILLAWIGIVGSIVTAIVALISAFVARQTSRANQRDLEKHQRELERLKTTLEEQKAEKDARRDYEYEARKRLYQQCEPLFFQLAELCENALRRIHSLARSASRGEISTDPYAFDWLYALTDYYLASTVYKLVTPLVIYRLIQRRLTLVDFAVDPKIKSQYLLAKRLYLSFTDDFELASTDPKIEYDPNSEDYDAYKASPEKYARQGLVAGSLDKVVDQFVRTEPDGTQRCITYGEFEAAYYPGRLASEEPKEIDIPESFKEFAEMFLGFHPKTRPVLWRILVAQAHIFEALIRTGPSKLATAGDHAAPILTPIAMANRTKFDWRDHKSVEASDEECLSQPFDVAERYLRKYLGELFL